MKKENKNKSVKKLPMPGKVKKGFRFYCTAVLTLAFVLGCSVTAFAASDPSQRSQGFLTLAGGIVITFAKEILNLITG